MSSRKSWNFFGICAKLDFRIKNCVKYNNSLTTHLVFFIGFVALIQNMKWL